MKQIIKFLKKMSVENALFFFSMFGVAMMALLSWVVTCASLMRDWPSG